MLRKFLLGSALPLALVGCGGDDGSSGASPTPTPTSSQPTPTPSPTPTPTPVPSGAPPIGINDGYVSQPAVLSTDRTRYGARAYQGIPTLTRVGSRLWAAWLANATPGKYEDIGDFVVLSYSDDDGATWPQEYYLVPADPAIDRATDPMLWTAPNGNLWVMYTQTKTGDTGYGNGKTIDGQLGAWLTVVTNPLDATPTFPPATRITDGMPRKPFFARGNWYWPIDYPLIKPRFSDRAGKNLFQFDPVAGSFAYVAKVPSAAGSDFLESTLQALGDGRILSQARNSGGISQSIAPAGSLRFSTPSLWTAYPSIPSRNTLGRSKTGRLFNVFNMDIVNGNRADMTIAFSDDDGATWPYSYTFDRRRDVTYPDVALAENGDILVIYDNQRLGLREIVLARIDEQSVISGSPHVTTKIVNHPPYPGS